MNGQYGNWPLSKYNSPGLYNPETEHWLPPWANTHGVNQIIMGPAADRFFSGPADPEGYHFIGDADYGDAEGYQYIQGYGDGGIVDTIKGALSKLVAFYKTPTGLMVGVAIALLLFTKFGKKVKRTALRIVKNPIQVGLFGGKAPPKTKAKRKTSRKATRKAAPRKTKTAKAAKRRRRFTGLGRGGYGPGPGARWRNADYRGRHVGSKTKMTKATRRAISENRHNKRRKR